VNSRLVQLLVSIVALTTSWTCSSQDTRIPIAGSEFAIKLLKGSEPICVDYTRRLRETLLRRNRELLKGAVLNNPHCDRGEVEAPGVFGRLERIPLAVAEVLRLQPQVWAFQMSPTSPLPDLASEKIAGAGPPYPAGSAAARQWSAIQEHDSYLYYRFDPSVDIDNDGSPDDVIVWKESGGICGEVYEGNEPAIFKTQLLVLTKDGRLDAGRTLKIFGHPKGSTLAFFNPKDPKHPNERTTTEFRGIGESFGVIEHKGAFYFDTFYADGGDLSNRRDGWPNYLDILAVMRNDRGANKLVCEILVK
jgi:hypothetical protein